MSYPSPGRAPADGTAPGPCDAADGAAVRVCRVEEVPTEGCVAVLDGRVLLARVDAALVAYRNQCLHRATPLDGGLVRDGVVTCPLHFWRYDLASGRNLAGGGSLERVPVWTDGDRVLVVPPAPAQASLREMLRDHARTGIPPREDHR